MSFPIIEHPVHSVDLSIGTVKFRPFLVKEQKLLMMAHDSTDVNNIVDNIKAVVNNCVVSSQFDIDRLPLVDLTQLFINIRARSIGEKLKLLFKCQNEVEGKACGMLIDSEVNLLELKPIGGGLPNKIMITDDIGVLMHYPTFSLLSQLVKAPTMETEFVVVAGCIDTVFDSNGVHKTSEASPEEVQKFVDGLPEIAYNKLKAFVESAPTIKAELKETCVKCNYTHDIKLEGLTDFFV
jgi:hypothetical protein